jgi:hypothetical protein
MSNPKYQSLKVTDSSEEIGDEAAANMAEETHAVSTIPSTHSSQHLMSPDSESVMTEEDQKSLRRRDQPEQTFSSVTSSQWFTVAVLCFINLINYMDRFTIAGECRTIEKSDRETLKLFAFIHVVAVVVASLSHISTQLFALSLSLSLLSVCLIQAQCV